MTGYNRLLMTTPQLFIINGTFVSLKPFRLRLGRFGASILWPRLLRHQQPATHSTTHLPTHTNTHPSTNPLTNPPVTPTHLPDYRRLPLEADSTVRRLPNSSQAAKAGISMPRPTTSYVFRKMVSASSATEKTYLKHKDN